MPKCPLASIVIPTRNRSRMLARTLATLAQQSVAGTFEVVVVDNGSTDDTLATLEDARRDYPMLQLRWTHEDRKGPGAARNRGLMQARGDIVLFTDDDCLPEHEWVEVIVNTFSTQPDLVGVEGLTYTYVDFLSPFLHFPANDGGVYPTCNIGYRASTVRAVGGFDTAAFPDCSAEDVDLGYRVMEKGPIAYQPAARVFHPPRTVDFWWQVERGRFLIRDDLCLRRRHAGRYGKVHTLTTGTDMPVRSDGEPLCITSLDVKTARNLLFHADLIRRPALYVRYVAMLALRTSWAMWLMPWSLCHVYRHRDPHRLPPLPEPLAAREPNER